MLELLIMGNEEYILKFQIYHVENILSNSISKANISVCFSNITLNYK